MDGLMLQSSFWELSRLYECDKDAFNLRFRSGAQSARSVRRFLHSFGQNMSAVIDKLQMSLQPKVFMWRTSNEIHARQDTKFWFDAIGKQVMEDINDRAVKVARQKDLDIIDFRHFHESDKLIDSMHPNPETSTLLADCAIMRALTAKEKQKQK